MRAKTVASRLAEHLAKARDEAQFRFLVESFQDRDGFELVVDTQKPVAADGRVVDVEHPTSGESYVLPFARAAARLGQPGQKSGVVPSEYGFHVMMLLERTPPHAVPFDERRRLLRDEIVTDRARRSKKDRLQRIRSSVSTSVERSAEALLATVDVGGHETPKRTAQPTPAGMKTHRRTTTPPPRERDENPTASPASWSGCSIPACGPRGGARRQRGRGGGLRRRAHGVLHQGGRRLPSHRASTKSHRPTRFRTERLRAG